MKWMGALLATLLVAGAIAEERSNPFSNPEEEVATSDSDGDSSSSAFVLRAVMPSGAVPLANIDGEILAVGETYQGFELAEISDVGVSLHRGSRVLELLLDGNRENTRE